MSLFWFNSPPRGLSDFLFCPLREFSKHVSSTWLYLHLCAFNKSQLEHCVADTYGLYFLHFSFWTCYKSQTTYTLYTMCDFHKMFFNSRTCRKVTSHQKSWWDSKSLTITVTSPVWTKEPMCKCTLHHCESDSCQYICSHQTWNECGDL